MAGEVGFMIPKEYLYANAIFTIERRMQFVSCRFCTNRNMIQVESDHVTPEDMRGSGWREIISERRQDGHSGEITYSFMCDKCSAASRESIGDYLRRRMSELLECP